jgi:hypothetical protein
MRNRKYGHHERKEVDVYPSDLKGGRAAGSKKEGETRIIDEWL